MQNKLLLLSLLSSFLFLSCKKNTEHSNSVTLKGKVVDYNTRLPIPGLKLHMVSGGYKIKVVVEPRSILYADTITSSNPPIHYISEDSVITDSQGNFSIQFTPLFLEGMYITPRFFTKVDTLIRVYPQHPFGISDDTNTDTVFFDKKSLLIINIQKSSTVFTNDTVFQNRIFYNTQNPYFFEPIIKGQIGFSNRTIKDEFSLTFYKNADIEWRYYRNGLQNSHRDTLNLISGVNNFNIVY